MTESKSYPTRFESYQNGYYFNYNIQEVTKSIEDSKDTFYEYNQVWIKEKTEEYLVEALIREKYSTNDEFKMSRIDSSLAEWENYDTYVKRCIALSEKYTGGSK